MSAQLDAYLRGLLDNEPKSQRTFIAMSLATVIIAKSGETILPGQTCPRCKGETERLAAAGLCNYCTVMLLTPFMRGDTRGGGPDLPPGCTPATPLPQVAAVLYQQNERGRSN